MVRKAKSLTRKQPIDPVVLAKRLNDCATAFGDIRCLSIIWHMVVQQIGPHYGAKEYAHQLHSGVGSICSVMRNRKFKPQLLALVEAALKQEGL